MKRLLSLICILLIANIILAPLSAFAQSANVPSNLSGFNTNNYADLGGPVIGASPRNARTTPGTLQSVREVTAPASQRVSPGLPGLPGNFVGGFFMLSPNISQLVQNLVIPHGVRAVYDFGISPQLNLSGNLVNSGRLYAVSSNPALSLSTINALNIFNRPGGLLTTVLPSNGIPGFANLNPALSLVLNASQNIVNQGQITSAANLTASAGASIVNALPATGFGTPALMQAAGNLNLFAGSGSITNAGLIQSTAGNINVSAALSSNMALNNSKGVLEALAGSINFRDSSFTGKTDLTILGGDLIAKTINLNSGCGTVDVLANDIQGVVNVIAGETHVAASTNNLVLGNIEVSGDPAFYNTAVNGDITIAGSLQFNGQDLAIVAQRNIITAPGAGVIDTSSTTGRAGDITIIAGANVSASSSSGPAAPGQVQPNTPNGNDANITLTISGGSTSGGNIDLTGAGAANITALNSSSTAGRGGNVTLAAFSGTDANSGVIKTPAAVSITTGGAGGDLANSNGNVLVIAGSSTNPALSIGPINTSNTTGPASATQTGSVDIVLSQPALYNSTQMQITGGTVVSGVLIGSNAIPANPVAAGDLSIQSEAGMSITSPGSISIGSLSSDSGGIIAAGKDIVSSAGNINITTADASGLGRNLQIVAGAPLTYTCSNCYSNVPGVNFSIDPNNPNGGNIDFSASASFQADSSSTAGNVNGGHISITAINNGATGGSITLPSTSSLDASGSGTGMAGNISVIGGGTAISLGSLRGNRVTVYGAETETSSGYSNSLSFDNRGNANMVVNSNYPDYVESLVPGTSKAANVTIGGNVNAESRFDVITDGSITFGGASTISGDATAANAPGASIGMQATSISIPGSISANGNGTGYAGNVFLKASTGNLTTGAISANGQAAGSISLEAVLGSVTTGALTATGNSGGNITVVSSNGISLGNVDTSASLGSGGYLLASTGNQNNSAVLSVGSVNTSGVVGGGLVLLVNSAPNTAATNLSVGNVNTDASGLDGIAGPVSLAASGAISLSDITAKATGNALSTAARGGSVFISSGGTGATAIDADNITIDTSATNNGAGDIAGNIILLSSAASTGADPTNIAKSGATFTASGGTPRAPFIWGLNGATSSIPNNLNVTASAAINIRPGGYQTYLEWGSYSTPLALNLDTGDDTQLVVPINTGYGDATQLSDTSIYLSSVNQVSVSGLDNIALFASGPIQLRGDILNATNSGTEYLLLVTPAKVYTYNTNSGSFKLNVGNLTVAAASGITFDNPTQVSWTGSKSLAVLGDMNGYYGSLNSSISLTSGANLIFRSIGSSTCCSSDPSYIKLSAAGSINGHNITLSEGTGSVIANAAASFISLAKVTAASGYYGGGGVSLSSAAFTSTGDIDIHGYYDAPSTTITSGSTITTGNILGYSYNGSGGNILVSANGAVSALNLQGNSATCCNEIGGLIYVNSSSSYLSLGTIGSSREYGGQIYLKSATYTDVGDLAVIGHRDANLGSSSIAISAGTSITTGDIATASNSCCGYKTGELTLTAGSSIRYSSIRSGAQYYNTAGNVFLTAGTDITGGTINTSDGAAGNIALVAGNQISVGAINASHSSGCSGNCGGGNVMLISSGGPLTVNGSISTNSNGGIGGSVSLTAAGAIAVNSVNTSSTVAAGNIFVSSGSTAAGAVAVGSLDSSSSKASAGAAGKIFLGANTSGTNGPSATGNASISFSKASTYSQSTTPNPYLFYDSASPNITTDTTLQIDYSGSVDIYPGVYVTDIGSSGTPVLLTLDLGGDSRTIVPVVSLGNVFLTGLNANNDGSMASQFNGYKAILVSNAANGISLQGNATSIHVGAGSDGDISMYSLAAGGNTTQTAGTITGGTLSIFSISPSTDLGSVGTPVQASISGLNAVTGGNAGIYVNAAGSSLYVGIASAGGAIAITSAGNLVTSTVTSSTSINLQTSAGTLSGFGRITAPSIVLAASGNITMLTGAQAIAASSSSGNVTINNASWWHDPFPWGSAALDVGNISGKTIQVNNSGDLNVTGTISGDNVTFNAGGVFDTAGGSSIAPNLSLTVNAGSGITLSSGVLSLTPGSNGGRGADVSLISSNGTVFIDSDISTTPYGNINISMDSDLPFTIGPGSTGPNGINGKLIANGTGALTAGGVTINNDGNGGITLLDPSYIVVSQPGIVLSNGGQITLDANNGTLTINALSGPVSTLSTDGAAGGAAGSISLIGRQIIFPSNSNLAVSANGINDATNIAVININSADYYTPVQVGSGLGQISISATGGGKTISVSSSGDLTVDMSAVTFDHPGFRNSVSFSSNNNLLINGDIDVSGVPANNSLQSITLSSYGSMPFTIGPGNSSINGITGRLIAEGINDAGGSISVTSYTGINLLDPEYISVATTGAPASTGGKIVINAGYDNLTVGFAEGNKNANNILTGTLSVDSLGANSTFSSANPMIDIDADALIINGGNLVLSANGGSGFRGGGISVSTYGSITVGSGAGELHAIANAGTAGAGGNISITIFNSTDALNLSGGIVEVDGAGAGGVGGTINIHVPTINVTGNTTLSASGSSKAGNITLEVSNPGSILRIGSASNEIQLKASGGNGNVTIDNSGDVIITGNSSVLSVVDDTLAILATSVDYTNGVIDVGTGTLQLTPNGPSTTTLANGNNAINLPIVIGGTAKVGGEFDITAAELANTTAGTLLIGTPFYGMYGDMRLGNFPYFSIVDVVDYPVAPHILNAGDINIASNLDLSKFPTVSLKSCGDYNATGKTITVGSHFQVMNSGDFNSGTIAGGSGSQIEIIQVNRNGTPNFLFNVDGPLTVSGGGSIALCTAYKAQMVIAADVGGGANTTIAMGIDGTLQQTAGVIAGKNVTFQGAASFGSDESIINMSAANFTGVVTGDIYVNQSGRPLSINASTVGGVFYLSSASPITTTGPILATQVHLNTHTGSSAGITIGSNITGTFLYGNTGGAAVEIIAAGSGAIIRSAGTITGPTVYLESGRGNIGKLNNPILTDADEITINTGTRFSGTAYVSNTGAVTLHDSQAGGVFNFTNNGKVTVNSIATGRGAINVITTSGGITVNPGSILNAVDGSLTLQTPNNNTITIGANASLNAASTDPSKGDVLIAVGTVQKIVNAGPPPSNYSSSTANGGVIYYGNFGITAATSPNNIATADTNDVAFSTNAAGLIVLGGGVKISARPVSHYLSSLDLTDPQTVAQIQTLISEGVITGSLQVAGGVATGGSITIPQDSLVGGLGLSALKIPAGVTVNLSGTWQTNSPLQLNVASNSDLNQVAQIGTLTFSGGANQNVVIRFGTADYLSHEGFQTVNLSKINNVGGDSTSLYGTVQSIAPGTANNGPTATVQTYLFDSHCPEPPPSQEPAAGTFSEFSCSGSAYEHSQSALGGMASGVAGSGGKNNGGPSMGPTYPPQPSPPIADTGSLGSVENPIANDQYFEQLQQQQFQDLTNIKDGLHSIAKNGVLQGIKFVESVSNPLFKPGLIGPFGGLPGALINYFNSFLKDLTPSQLSALKERLGLCGPLF